MIDGLDEYQREAIKTMKEMTLEETNKYCGLLMSEETGEINRLIVKHYYHGKDLKIEDLKGELSDVLWGIANLAHANGLTLSEIATFCIEKARKRHGEKYNQLYYKE
jgi:NTP pyrophosphatase (non-canonical NTP hydrolase)